MRPPTATAFSRRLLARRPANDDGRRAWMLVTQSMAASAGAGASGLELLCRRQRRRRQRPTLQQAKRKMVRRPEPAHSAAPLTDFPCRLISLFSLSRAQLAVICRRTRVCHRQEAEPVAPEPAPASQPVEPAPKDVDRGRRCGEKERTKGLSRPPRASPPSVPQLSRPVAADGFE